ncbi:hypothetical protein A2Y99_03740 [Candidatus Gottesmanbacteria bacterium RBG_13_37_7]|uniref:Glycosyltransferase RgtA/B/C/D-like domain-containing protein n=1 Tax=Candidatus Gottesmanbacteria bacterium RBG_13_37_7 TaxID=1798369 RepID=A0A1F5YKW1_9BACT|nr:MAG: hypothetical protein A2Y99_03740 [Candidatus Gottesmanbacteria bacterium RBG_13_37_7]
MQSLGKFLKANKFRIILILILILGAFFRFYRIRDYLTFLGDEGRDVLVVKRMIVDHKFTLLGPITSVGSMYMGPVFYYFMIPFLWLFNLDPVGPAVMVALFSLATLYLVYRLGSEFFNRSVGLIASFLFAISPLPITYARSSWNPNIVPFFSLTTIYALLKAIVKKEFRWMIIVGLSLGIMIQLHYVSFMFFPIIVVSLLITKTKIPIKYYLICLCSFILSYSPFILFELRHRFVNSYAVWNFLFQSKSDNAFWLSSFCHTTSDVLIRLFWRLVIIQNAEITKFFLILILIFFLLWWKTRNRYSIIQNKSLLIILCWLVIGLISFGIYQGLIYDYYLVPIWLLPFLIFSLLIVGIKKFLPYGKIISIIVLLFVIYFNLSHSPLKIPPSNLLKNTEIISKFVFEKTEGQSFNFALIAGKNSDHAYRYFLEIWGNPPTLIENPQNDPERKTVKQRLFVVCEEKVCEPLGHPLWEIAGFGRAEVEYEWRVETAKVYQLRHFNNKIQK